MMEILRNIDHRPWPLPSKNWIMRQSWRNVLFVHYPVSSEYLRTYIPSSLEIDTYKGTAWLGMVAFMMEGIFPRGLSSISLTPSFSEINVRTYVHFNGKPGVYFLSLDVNDWASYTIARRWYRLPYQRTNISYQQEGETFYFESARKSTAVDSPISIQIKYTPLSEVYFPKEGTLDHWLTERYCLFSSNKKGNIFCGEIHHQPWPIQNVKAEINRNTLYTPFKKDNTNLQPLYHFSKGVDTLFWNIKRV